jgi:hypothetical protein
VDINGLWIGLTLPNATITGTGKAELEGDTSIEGVSVSIAVCLGGLDHDILPV